MVANFEIFFISQDFIYNFRKGRQVSKSLLKSSESYGKKTEGVPKDPLHRIGLNALTLAFGFP